MTLEAVAFCWNLLFLTRCETIELLPIYLSPVTTMCRGLSRTSSFFSKRAEAELRSSEEFRPRVDCTTPSMSNSLRHLCGWAHISNSHLHIKLSNDITGMSVPLMLHFRSPGNNI